MKKKIVNIFKFEVHNLYNKWIKLKFLTNFKEKDSKLDLFSMKKKFQ